MAILKTDYLLDSQPVTVRWLFRIGKEFYDPLAGLDAEKFVEEAGL